jgi:hypothetical protein
MIQKIHTLVEKMMQMRYKKKQIRMNEHNHPENDAPEVSNIKVCFIFITITEH